MTHVVSQLITLYDTANQQLRLISSIQYGRRKKRTKQKLLQIQKQNVNSYRFEVADDEYGNTEVVRCVICNNINENSGNNGKLVYPEYQTMYS